MTVYFLASSGATRYQDRCVSGAPWISSSGGPEPPTTVYKVAPLVLTLCTLKPGSRRASAGPASTAPASAARTARLDASRAPAHRVSPARSTSRLSVRTLWEPGVEAEFGLRIGPSRW